MDGLCGGEEAIAAANFGRVGAKGEKVSGFAEGSRPTASPAWRGRARGCWAGKPDANLPKLLLLAVTEKRLIAFDASYRYSVRRHKRETGRPVEVTAWDRAAVRVEVAKPEPEDDAADRAARRRRRGQTSPGPSTADDPWSLR